MMMLKTSLVTLLLLATVVWAGDDPAVEDGLHPCNASLEDATWYPLSKLRPSYVEDCLSSLEIDKDLMMEHIHNLGQTFQQYFCFFNLVNDPANSDPLSYQPELGYSMFGEGEGQVKLEEELIGLIQNINATGATAADFWEVQTIFNKLYDAHVNLPELPGSLNLAGSHFLGIIPERNMWGETPQKGFLQMLYDENNDFSVYVVWLANGTITVDTLETIDDMDPYDFFYDLVANPATAQNWPYQSIGARMNALAQKPFLDPFSAEDPLTLLALSSSTRPSDYLPENFTVIYASGEEETYYTSISYNEAVENVHGALSSIPDFSGISGAAYRYFETAIGKLSNETEEVRTLYSHTNSMNRKYSTGGRYLQDEENAYAFDEVINVPQAGDALAFKIENDYAVLKIQGFNFLFDHDGESAAMMNVWSNFTIAAQAKGVTKAIIDISGNGGGTIRSGNILAASMFPTMPYEVFIDQYDINYNDPMDVFNIGLIPVVEALGELLQNLTDADFDEYLTVLNNGTQNMNVVASALTDFCVSNCVGEDSCVADKCQDISLLSQSIDALIAAPAGTQLRSVIESLILAIFEYNPNNVLGVLETGEIDLGVTKAVMRGGVSYNLTDPFSEFSRELFDLTVNSALDSGPQFEEYVIVSDGVAGSTTDIFASMVMQLWKNRDQSGVTTPLTTVTYGGTKDPSDTTVAGFPASVQDVQLHYPLITSSLIYMLEFVLPFDDIIQPLREIQAVYDSVLPIPPYFGETLPRMPVMNYYSNYMQPGAIPMQYVKKNGDYHIPRFFIRNAIKNSGDLAMLYGKAYEYFGLADSNEIFTDSQSSNAVAGSEGESDATSAMNPEPTTEVGEEISPTVSESSSAGSEGESDATSAMNPEPTTEVGEEAIPPVSESSTAASEESAKSTSGVGTDLQCGLLAAIMVSCLLAVAAQVL